MKTLISILAVVAIAIAVTVSSASDVQLLSNVQMSSFVGACCVENTPSGPTCSTYIGDDQSSAAVAIAGDSGNGGCWVFGNDSERWNVSANGNDPQTKVCQSGGSNPNGCDMTGNVNCGINTSKKTYDLWDGNDFCSGDPDWTVESFHRIESANGTSCP